GVYECNPLSLHDALPIYLADIPGVVVTTNVELVLDTKIEETKTSLDPKGVVYQSDESSMTKTTETPGPAGRPGVVAQQPGAANQDRKSTRLNSSHVKITY